MAGTALFIVTHTVLAFNVQIPHSVQVFADELGVEIIHSDVIYQLLESFKARKRVFLEKIKDSEEFQAPCIAAVAPGYIISTAEPLILGLSIIFGTLQVGSRLYLEDRKVCPAASIDLL